MAFHVGQRKFGSAARRNPDERCTRKQRERLLPEEKQYMARMYLVPWQYATGTAAPAHGSSVYQTPGAQHKAAQRQVSAITETVQGLSSP